MEFRVLGPLEVVARSGPIELAGGRQRSLLAFLLAHAGEVVSAERLLEELWGGDGRGAVGPLQVSVSRLRKVLGGSERITMRAGGYVLRVDPDEYDRDVFAGLAGQGRDALREGRPSEAAELCRRAMELWRGEAFADFRYESFAQVEIARLEEARLACVEDRIEADLAMGRHAELVGELDGLVREWPLRERLRAHQMLALYRSGRQIEALEVYRAVRGVWAGELGIEPGAALRGLEAAILRQDAELDLPEATAVVTELRSASPESEPAPVGAVRKTVTVLVAAQGLDRPSQTDPEVRRRAGDRLLAAVQPVLRRHGATVERLLDGQVVGIFGIPVGHEDDALRAVRTAVEARDASLPVAFGIDTGEVLAGGEVAGEPSVTGEPLEAAAVLAASARPGTVVMGAGTLRHVRDAVRVERAGELDAWRVLELIPGAPALRRRLDTPLIGRSDELAQLRQSFSRASRERRAQLFTAFGEAGIGKTRLALELGVAVAGEATVLTGRCLAYGEGITYWPLREIVGQATADRSLEEILAGEERAALIADRIGTVVGQADVAAAGEETFWAVRKLAEALARQWPLVLVFEDVHWAEPTLLDLVEHLASWIREAPVLLVCLARPELLEVRPGWGGGALNATAILLEPLSESESADLAKAFAGDLGERERGRAVATAQGNPLFLEQTLALLAEDGDTDGARALPPAIQALLAARLDRLPPEQRRLVGCAAVEGESFHVGAVAALSELDVARVEAGLDDLVAKELVRPDRPTLTGEQAYRFRHSLVRDAAYDSLPKQERARMHERYADWLEAALGDRITEGEEFLGYHLEQAWRYESELAGSAEHLAGLALRAGCHLDSAARRALARADLPAAVGLFERALELLPATSPMRLGLMPDLAYALFFVGHNERVEAIAAEAIETARAAGDRRIELHAVIVRSVARMYLHPEAVELEQVRAEAAEAASVFEFYEDDVGRSRLGDVLLEVRHLEGCVAAATTVAEEALGSARRARSRQDVLAMTGAVGWELCVGPMHADEARQHYRLVALGRDEDPTVEALAGVFLAVFDGLGGRFGDAEESLARARAGLVEMGLDLWVGAADLWGARVATLAGDLPLAEARLRAAIETFGEAGSRWFQSIAELDLVRVLHERGRHDEAIALDDAFGKAPRGRDPGVESVRLANKGVLLAARSELLEAEWLISEAVRIADGTDMLWIRGDALVDLAAVLARLDRCGEAAAALEQAIVQYEQKGVVVLAAKARERLRALRA
jgi:DNA-binding SARP family transcriptional activator